MPRKQLNDGMEVIFQDHNELQGLLLREIYDRVIFEMTQRQENAFFGDSLAPQFASPSQTTVLKGVGFQTDATVPATEPEKRLIYKATNTTVTHPAADPVSDRIDLIVVRHAMANGPQEARKFKAASSDEITSEQFVTTTDWDAEIEVIQGEAAANPVAPALPADALKIAEVLVTAISGIAGVDSVTDCRTLMPVGALTPFDTVAFEQLSSGDATSATLLFGEIDALLKNGQTCTTTYQDLLDDPAAPEVAGERIVYNRGGSLFVRESESEGGTILPLGSGGGGLKNYISDSNSSIGASLGDWVTEDGAGVASIPLTVAATDTVGSVLAGTHSMVVSKSAVDAQGHFAKVRTDLIDQVDRGRILFGSFEFVPGADYKAGDLCFEAFDLTNAEVIYAGPSSDLEILNTDGKFYYSLYTKENTAQIELRIKVNSASADAYSVTVDDFTLGPATQIPTSPRNTIIRKDLGVSTYEDIVFPSLTFDNLEIGRTYEVRGRMGIILNVGADSDFAGRAVFRNGPDALYVVDFTLNENVDTGNDLATFGVAFTFTATDTVMTVEGQSLTAGAGVVGSSFVELERRYDLETQGAVNTNELFNKGAFFQAAASAASSHTRSGSTQAVVFPIVVEDTHNAYNPVTGEYTCPTDGFIQLGVTIGFSPNATGFRLVRIDRNGSLARNLSQQAASSATSDFSTYSATLRVSKGDVLTVAAFQNSGGNLAYNSGTRFFEIKYMNDLTTLGVIRNDQYLISENVSQNILGAGPLNTYIDLDPGWFLDVPDGAWSLAATVFIEASSVVANSTAYPVTVLSTAATAAEVDISNIVAFNKGASVGNGADTNNRGPRWQHHNLVNKRFVSTGQRLKVYGYGGNLSNSTTFSMNLRNDIGSLTGRAFIASRRIK